LIEDGVDVRLNTTATAIEKTDKGKFIVLEKDGKQEKLQFDEILIAVGRIANLKGFGLEKLGIETNRVVVTNEMLQTKYPNILAAGDVAGPYQFTHTAAHQAWYAAVNALFRPFKTFKVDYRVIPWATFTDPEIATVGLNEQAAKEQGMAYEVTKYDIGGLDRALTDDHARGFVKVLTPLGKDKILGATIVGAHAGELIAEFVLAMKYNLGMNKILGTIHIYPTMAESSKYAAGNWKKAHAPEKLLAFVERFHTWRRS
jgi:pyruvate/2-oxoglutarate dehydrogenase complex dihydrolipoamide dehydrogenase (E3) component